MFHLRAPYILVQQPVAAARVGAEVLVDDRSAHGIFALHAVFLIGGLAALGYWFGPQIVPSVAAPAGRAIGASLGLATGTALATIA